MCFKHCLEGTIWTVWTVWNENNLQRTINRRLVTALVEIFNSRMILDLHIETDNVKGTSQIGVDSLHFCKCLNPSTKLMQRCKKKQCFK